MADILKVTTPMSGYDNSTIKNNPRQARDLRYKTLWIRLK